MAEQDPGLEVVRAACPHDCPDTCAMLVTVRRESGKRVAIKVAGDPTHPTTAGTLCTKVSRYLERTYHPDRLLHPLKRVGRKGEGRFVRATWDEALAEISERLKSIAAIDPQRIVPYSYAGTMGMVQGEAMAQRFFHKLGASFLDRTICATAGGEALTATLGTRDGTDIEQFQNAKLIVFWGTNAITSNLHLWSRAQEAKRHGARLIAIDPYRSLTAEKCHQHIALLPGTDGAFALGVMHVLVREGWLDRDYIERYTLGFEALAARAEEFDPRVSRRSAASLRRRSSSSRGNTRRYGRRRSVSTTACSARPAAVTRCAQLPACQRSPVIGAIRPADCCCPPAATIPSTQRGSIGRSCSRGEHHARSTCQRSAATCFMPFRRSMP